MRRLKIKNPNSLFMKNLDMSGNVNMTDVYNQQQAIADKENSLIVPKDKKEKTPETQHEINRIGKIIDNSKTKVPATKQEIIDHKNALNSDDLPSDAVFIDKETGQPYLQSDNGIINKDGNLLLADNDQKKTTVNTLTGPGIASQLLGNYSSENLQSFMNSLNPIKPINNVEQNSLNNSSVLKDETTPIVDNSISIQGGVKKPSSMNDADWQLYQSMNQTSNQQLGLDSVRALEYLTNAFQATNQPSTVGLKGPTYSFTPTASTRDRDLSELNRQAASSVAKTNNMLEQYGMQDRAIGAMAEQLNQIMQGKYQISSQEAQRQTQNDARFDEYFNAQTTADATIQNKNVEKTMMENQQLGAEYTGNMENFFRTATDINRQRQEKAMVKNLALGPMPQEDKAGYYKSLFGFATAKKTKESDNQNKTN